MATIEQRKSHTGKVTYRAKIRLRGFPPISETFDTKTHAKRWAQAKEAAMLEGRHFPEAKAKKSTVADLIDVYLEDLAAKNPRRSKEVEKILAWWKTEFGYIILADFSSQYVMRAQYMLRKRETRRKDEAGKPLTLGNATINRYTVALSTAFNFGIRRLKWIQDGFGTLQGVGRNGSSDP